MNNTIESQKANNPTEPHANAAAFEDQLRASMDDLLRKTRIHQDAWRLGEEDQWFLDEGSGEVVFTFADSVASAPAQVIGTFDSLTGLWTWAWADAALPPELKQDALRLKEYGEEHGFQHLVVPTWQAEETHCWYMTALACALFEASGAYRGTSGHIYTFITFREVAACPVSEPEEETVVLDVDEFITTAIEDFKAALEDPEQQRQACCRYLKRGVRAGVAQDDLIHRLGLSAPSILDLAGYSAELADNVMATLKTISDEEILECPV